MPGTVSAASSSTVSANVTDSEIANSSMILGRVGGDVVPPISYQTAKQRVTATPEADNLVQITASGSTPPQAEQLANHVASQLVAFLTSTGDSVGGSAVSQLQAEASQLNKQITTLGSEIKDAQWILASVGSSSAAGIQEAKLLGSLTNAESNAELELQSVDSQIQSTRLQLAVNNGGTEVLEYASTTSSTSPIKSILTVLIGAVVGFLLGSALVISRRKRRKISLRDEFARVVGARVLLSLSVGRWGNAPSTSKWSALLREPEPSPGELLSVSNALDQLELSENDQPTMTVITLAKDVASMILVTRFASSSASMGIPTSLILTSDELTTLRLSDAYDTLVARGESGLKDLRIVKDSAPVESSDGALTIISMILDPDAPKLPAYVARGLVVLCVTAGFSDQEELNRVLLAIGREGLTIVGIFVTNPVGGDNTSGISPDFVTRGSQLLQRTRLDLLPDVDTRGVEIG